MIGNKLRLWMLFLSCLLAGRHCWTGRLPRRRFRWRRWRCGTTLQTTPSHLLANSTTTFSPVPSSHSFDFQSPWKKDPVCPVSFISCHAIISWTATSAVKLALGVRSWLWEITTVLVMKHRITAALVKHRKQVSGNLLCLCQYLDNTYVGVNGFD